MRYLDTDYDIYEDGRCFSNKTNKWLTPKMSAKYPTYNLTFSNKIKKQIKVHCMVAETFLPRIKGKDFVNHKDGDTHNFNLNNLEWVTLSENAKHASKIGLRSTGNRTLNYYEKDLPNEEWVIIEDFPLYSISSYGRIMNNKTKVLLKQALGVGYLEVNLHKDKQGNTKHVHHLEYQCFHKDEDLHGFVINHKDGNKINNKLENLEKISYTENNIHAAYVIKTNKCCKPVNQILNGKIINIFPSIAEASRQTRIYNISKAVKNKSLAGGYYWELASNL